MKRFHVHLGVPDLATSIRFYSNLFGLPPSVEEPDYAKWMLEDPRVNFAISQRGSRVGINHLGLQADSADELADLRTHFAAADGGAVVDEENVSCCYARSDKHWVRDPQGIAWEAFHSLGSVPMYDGKTAGEPVLASCGTASVNGAAARAVDSATTSVNAGCCAPSPKPASAASGCCAPS